MPFAQRDHHAASPTIVHTRPLGRFGAIALDDETVSMQDSVIDLLIGHQDRIAELCQFRGVRKLEALGSAVTGIFDLERSDIDLIVEFADESLGFGRRYLAFAQALGALFGRRVDLIIDRPFKNLYFRSSVDRTRCTIYARTDSEAAA